jgi:acyl carrier protein
MSDTYITDNPPANCPVHLVGANPGMLAVVMPVLRGIRSLQSNGQDYDETSNLTDAGFTSVEMVKVMLGIEAAFDVMIPQDMITPENFTSGSAIAEMMAVLTKTT